MALSNDWEWIITLSLYAIGLSVAVISYNSSFNPDGSVKIANSSYNFTGFNSSNAQSSADVSSPGLSFLSSLSFGLPPGLASIFVLLFEVLPAGLLAVLLFRQFRSGGG